MEDIKTEPPNGTPLPQRNGPPASGGGGPAGNVSDVKKPRSQNPGFRGRGGGHGGGGNRGQFGNRGGGGMNRNRNQQNKNINDNDGGNQSIKTERNQGSGGGGGGGNNNNNSDDRREERKLQYKKNDDFMVNQKLKQLSGPIHDLPSIDQQEIKFSGRNRLYIGNLTNDVTEEELKELFSPYGEISEAFVNKEKSFAFIKVDYHANAEKAKRELDGSMRKGRQIRIRFAPNATTIKVKNLSAQVSNELLYKAFEIFGPVERAVVIVDDRGKPSGDGIVEFARKASATTAIRFCSDRCFFLTSSLRPCVVELFEHIDDTDGYPEKSLNKKNPEFVKSRQTGPRFADVGTFEHEYGTRWKQLHELYKQKHDALKREMLMEEDKLEAQMEYARYEHETELLREQLRMREQDRDRQKIEWEMKERLVEEQRSREEEQMRRQSEDMQMRMLRQEEELRRRQQENTLFMQAQQLNSLLDQQERKGNYDNDNRRGGGYDMQQGGSGMGGHDPNNYMDNDQYRQSSRFDDQGGNQGVGGGGSGGGGGASGPRGNQRQWDRRNDDFQNKRRRF